MHRERQTHGWQRNSRFVHRCSRRWLARWSLLGLAALLGCVHQTPHSPDTGEPGARFPALEESLRRHVACLAGEIGQRSSRNKVTYAKLEQAANYVSRQLQADRGDAGAGTLSEQAYNVDGRCYRNIELEFQGTNLADEIIVVGAHYDADGKESCGDNPGADDNASGVAALLELARAFAGMELKRTLRFVAFTNEEEPFFQTDRMGSSVYASGAKERGEHIPAMLSLETIGYYSDAPHSQHYPLCLGGILTCLFGFPDTGNFIAFVGNHRSKHLVQRTLDTYREATPLPAEGFVAAEIIPGVGWSDHWSFWVQSYPAVMVTDTAPQRNACYHKGCDRPGLLNYERMAQVVMGLGHVIESLVGGQSSVAGRLAEPPPPVQCIAESSNGQAGHGPL